MYTTSNLSDVATHFRQNASSARARSEIVKRKTEKRDLLVQAATWEQAAEFIDNVRIIPMQTR
jgi:uncharacterized protein (DUF1919 family)